jgi:hypothetical protein
MNRNRVVALLLTAGLVATSGWAQQSPSAKEAEGASQTVEDATKEEPEKQRQTWAEFVADVLTPKPYPREAVIFIDDKYAYPHVASSIKMEIVRIEEDVVWLKGLPPEDPKSPLYKIWAQRQADEARLMQRNEAMRTPGAVYFLDFKAEAVPPPFMDSLEFEPVGSGLPDVGRWQMGFVMADMNEDGHVDLVFPPQRKAIPPRPSIFLGDGTGEFELWRKVEWPAKLPFDYGGVAAEDFDGDGHLDLAIAVHFKSQYVIYGDGKGDFTEFTRLPTLDPRISSRAVTSADFNGDGRPDLAFVAEVDYDLSTNQPIEGAGTVWLLMNRGNSWQIKSDGLPENMIADVIRSADLNADGRPDLVLSSNAVNWRRLAYLNGGDEGWEPAHHRGVLSAAYHYNAEPVGDEIFATFVQFKVVEGSTQARNGLVRYTVTPADEEEFVNGEPLIWDASRDNVFFRIGTGDLDGDGDTDLVAGRRGGGLEIYLQGENGEFILEQAAELGENGRVFDLRLQDLNGDGFDDIVACFVPTGGVEGGVRVWLTRSAG